jgi:hypothetical protein
MARRIRLDQIGDYSEEKLNQLMRVVVFETDAELKARSPVDTGRFRASWIIGENATGNYDAGEQQPATGANRGKAQPPATPAPGPGIGLNYSFGQEKIKNTYHVHNNISYGQELADGRSKQAPAGWLDIVARQMTARARQLADSIGRQD